MVEFSNILHLPINFEILHFYDGFYSVLQCFYMYVPDAPPDEPLCETHCCGFNVLMSIL